MHKILLVDDAKEIQLIVSRIFSDGQSSLVIASTSAEAMHLMQAEKIDLVILDISLPDGDGFQLCSHFQNDPETREIPIVFLTGSEIPSSRLMAYSLGADDFLKKPISPAELKIIVDSKLQKIRRRAKLSQDLIAGPFRFHLGSQKVWSNFDQTPIELTAREFKILYFFARNESNVFTRQQILDEVWGHNTNVIDRSVDTYIYHLRKKLGALGHFIESVPGVGYRFSSEREKRKSAA